MSTFQLEFKPNFAGVTSPNGRVRLRLAQPPNCEPDAIESLQAIASALAALEQSFSQQLIEMQARLTGMAVSIAKIVLHDNDLIQSRVETFVNSAIEEFRPAVPESVYVHPSCVDVITKWIESSSQSAVAVQADPNVHPGDCRVEASGVGLVAALDNLLEVSLAELNNATPTAEAV